MYKVIDDVRVWGTPLENAVSQAVTCAQHGNVEQVLLMADHHKGYSQPVGGVVVYNGQISPSGVGYDIACGNKAVRTNINIQNIPHSRRRGWINGIMDRIQSEIAFGVGRTNDTTVDHDVFSNPDWQVYKDIDTNVYDHMMKLAKSQLGTVGSGNHFVDVFVEEATGDIWVANHFGSRGFGHKTATGFLNLASGDRKFFDKGKGESMDQPPTLFDLDSELGDMYFRAMGVAGQYAYAGRDYVIDQVLGIMGATATFEVHNHHNYAWKEVHNGREYVIVRKGATPSAPGQLGFIGGSMGDMSVIVEGKDSQENKDAFYSTVHGAGRVMSRTQAAGKMNWKTRTRSGGEVTPEQMKQAIDDFGVTLRGAGTDESPFVYKKLSDVIGAHSETVEVKHTLRPIGVCMAGENEFDPYKD